MTLRATFSRFILLGVLLAGLISCQQEQKTDVPAAAEVAPTSTHEPDPAAAHELVPTSSPVATLTVTAIVPTATILSPTETADPLPASTEPPETIVETPVQSQQSGSDEILEESIFELIPNWEAGESHMLEFTKARIDYEEGAIMQQTNARTAVELHVAERDEAGYVFVWTNGKTEIENPAAAMDPALEAITNLGNGMAVEYETDYLGVPVAVRNWEEIALLLQESIDVTIDFLESSGMSQLELQQIRETVEPMFSSKEQIETFATKEIQLYHLVYGWETLEVSAPIAYEVLLPNPFGGEPFPGIMQLELVEMNVDDGTAVLNWNQTLDPSASRQILMDTFADMSATMGSAPPIESDLPEPFSIDDNAEIHVDLASGWIKTLEHTRKIVIGPMVREDITKILELSD